MSELRKLLGTEVDLDRSNRALRDYVRSLGAPVVGAMHILCADESEWECAEAFQRHVVSELLPPLKFAQRSAFRLCNLGARYEEGALAVAEHHYATPEAQHTFKTLVVKVSSHVAVEGAGPTCRFGQMRRYEAESTACGALHALLAGKDLPALRELGQHFRTERDDRLATLLDPDQVRPDQRSLFVAVTNARLQAARVERAVAHLRAHGPTIYVIAPCVTLNRAARDTELLCGLATADCRDDQPKTEYVGLADDPARYELHDDFGHLRVTDTDLRSALKSG